jgi:hypothetical protein
VVCCGVLWCAAGAGEGYAHFAGTDGSKSFITGGLTAALLLPLHMHVGKKYVSLIFCPV